jgi:predicted nucleic acid-binding protein
MQTEPFAEESRRLLSRSARRELQLFTASHTAAEVIHRVMIIKGQTRFGLSSKKSLGYLKRYPDAVKQLTKYKQIPGKFTQARIHILPVTYQEIHSSKHFRDSFGLLTNDSIILAVMSQNRIADLATNDADFRRVPGIHLWTPTG